MADINVERKGPSIWPWVAGLLVLALLIWAVAEMVDTDRDVGDVAVEEEFEQEPGALPLPEAAKAQDFDDLLPLGPEDQGQQVELEGVVTGKAIDSGYWLLTDEDHLIFVMSIEKPESGKGVEITGTIETTLSSESEQRLGQAGVTSAEGWVVEKGFVVRGGGRKTETY